MSIEILSEEKRELLIAEPPKNALPHLWSSKKEMEGLKAIIAAGTLLDAYISKRAEAKMRNHALSMRDQKTEVMGLLLGDVRKWQERTYLLVRDVVTTDLDATAISVRFDRKGFEKLFENLDDVGFDYIIIGWYHSHPGYGCYMSDTDIDTQTRMFVSPFHLAMVIDPVNMDIGAFKVRDKEQVLTRFAIYWDEHDDPYGGVGRVRQENW